MDEYQLLFNKQMLQIISLLAREEKIAVGNVQEEFSNISYNSAKRKLKLLNRYGIVSTITNRFTYYKPTEKFSEFADHFFKIQDILLNEEINNV